MTPNRLVMASVLALLVIITAPMQIPARLSSNGNTAVKPDHDYLPLHRGLSEAHCRARKTPQHSRWTFAAQCRGIGALPRQSFELQVGPTTFRHS